MGLETTMFGPYRAVGMRYTGKNENNEIMGLWAEFLPRREEIAMAESGGAFGVCRCLPGVMDGSYEYVAAFASTPDAAVPAGMMSLDIPQGEYCIQKFDSVKDYKQAWNDAMRTFAANPEWGTYCNGPDDCQCAAHPCFEYYPPEFSGTGPVWICMAVRRK